MQAEIIKKLEDFFSQYPKQEFKKGTIIISADEDPLGILFVKSGVVKNYRISPEGTTTILNMFKPHSFLPMSWAIADIKNNSFYEAATDIMVNKAPKQDVLNFLEQEPRVVFDLLRRVYVGLEGLWMHLESATSGNSSTKLITTLVMLAKRFGKQEKNGLTVQLKLHEQEIANYSGMTRETASREIQKLKKDNLVGFDKGIIVVKNIQKLETMLTT